MPLPNTVYDFWLIFMYCFEFIKGDNEELMSFRMKYYFRRMVWQQDIKVIVSLQAGGLANKKSPDIRVG